MEDLNAKIAARDAARAAWQETRQQHAAATAEAERLRAEQTVRAQEVAAFALVPGHDLAPTADGERARIAARVEQLERMEHNARTAYDVAEQSLQEVLRPAIRAAVQRLTDASATRHGVLGEFGRAVAVAYCDDVLGAGDREVEARRELDTLLHQLAGDPRVVHRQRAEVAAHLAAAAAPAEPALVVGSWIVALLNWTRRGGSPVLPLWDELEVTPVSGASIYQAGAPVAAEDVRSLRLAQRGQ